jgi:hypothetical protein
MHEQRERDLLLLALCLPTLTSSFSPHDGQMTAPVFALIGAKGVSPSATTSVTSGAMRASDSSMSNDVLHFGHLCGQALIDSSFTASTGEDITGVRWPQPVT